MTLIKSKINSLAWLKSALYISVVGGVILSSKPAASANFTTSFRDSPLLTTLYVRNANFEGGSNSTLFAGDDWSVDFIVTETQGSLRNDDELVVTVLLQHLTAPHPGDNSLGGQLRLVFNLDAGDTESNQITIRRKATPRIHPGRRNHLDTLEGILTADITPRLGGNDIDSWTVNVTGEHVPEPLTIFGTGIGLGFGALFKKKLREQDKKK